MPLTVRRRQRHHAGGGEVGAEVALLIERQRVETTLDERAVTLAAEALDDASAAHEQGFVSSTELDAARTDLLTAEHDHAQSRLALDELVLATRPIHRTLSAPRVAGRDFVTESLDLERQYRIRRLELLAQSAQREQHLVDIGALPEHASADARRRLEAASSELDLLEDRLDLKKCGHNLKYDRLALRASYLDQALLPDECERRDRVLVAEHRQREIQAELAHLTTARDRGILRSDAHMAVDVDPISLL